jgi:hypothetical protein
VVVAGPSTGHANLAVSFEQVSGEVQYGGAPKVNTFTVGGGGPVAPAARVAQPAVGTLTWFGRKLDLFLGAYFMAL